MQNTISRTDRSRVRDAISAAEKHTSGEIVVVVAHQSDDYLHVPVHIAAAAALAFPIIWALSAKWLGWPLPVPVGWVFAYQLILFIVVAVVLSVPALRYQITPRRLMRKYAHRHAATQFLARNLHTTRHRTGVLIFVSLLERYCEIVADVAVAEKVKNDVWQGIIDEMMPVIRAGKLGDGLVLGVERCGVLLAEHFPPSAHNPDELPDHLIVI